MVATKQADGTWQIDGLEPWEDTFERMKRDLKKSVPFKFARYGDGEIFCMNGRVGRNCDKHEYFPDLGLALHKASQRASYMVGVQPLSVSEGHSVEYFHGLDLYNADVLHNASIHKRLQEFIDVLQHRFVVIVGPQHLKTLPFYHLHIEIPSLNCWNSYENTCKEIGVLTDQEIIRRESIVFLLCASMMSEVIIDRFRESSSTFIDCGSVFDPLVGVKSRRYHHNL